MRETGQRMLTFRTEHHLTAADLAKILIRFSMHHRYRTGDHLTRLQLEGIVRNVLADYGTSAQNVTDTYFQQDVARWAVSTIRRLYPEMSDQRLTDLLYIYGVTDD